MIFLEFKDRDGVILGNLEKMEQYSLKIQESYTEDFRDNLHEALLAASIRKIRTSRRAIEDLSRPSRMMLEHFSYFIGDHTHSMGYKIGQFLDGRSVLVDFEVEEWGNIVLNLGNITLKWRDEDYTYLFYPDKIMIKSKNRSNPDFFLSFSFSFNYTKVHLRYKGIKDDPQTEYWHEGLEVE